MAKPSEIGTEPSRVVVLQDHRAQQEFEISHGGSGGGGTVDRETKQYVDKSMDVVRAENDKRFSEVLLKLDAIKVPPIWQIAGVAFVTLGAVFAILAYASDRFDGGLAASSLIDALGVKQSARDEQQDLKLDQILDQVRKFGAKSEISQTNE